MKNILWDYSVEGQRTIILTPLLLILNSKTQENVVTKKNTSINTKGGIPPIIEF